MLTSKHVIEAQKLKVYMKYLTLYSQGAGKIIMDRLKLPGKVDVSYLENSLKNSKNQNIMLP